MLPNNYGKVTSESSGPAKLPSVYGDFLIMRVARRMRACHD